MIPVSCKRLLNFTHKLASMKPRFLSCPLFQSYLLFFFPTIFRVYAISIVQIFQISPSSAARFTSAMPLRVMFSGSREGRGTVFHSSRLPVSAGRRGPGARPARPVPTVSAVAAQAWNNFSAALTRPSAQVRELAVGDGALLPLPPPPFPTPPTPHPPPPTHPAPPQQKKQKQKFLGFPPPPPALCRRRMSVAYAILVPQRRPGPPPPRR